MLQYRATHTTIVSWGVSLLLQYCATHNAKHELYIHIQLFILQAPSKHPECTICTIKKHIHLYYLSDNTAILQNRLPQLLSFICIIYLSTLLCNTVYLCCYSYLSLLFFCISLSLIVICIFYLFLLLFIKIFYIDVLYFQNVNRTL